MAINEQLPEEPTKGIITSLIGYERCDIAFLLGELFNLVKKNTLIIDNSISHDLYNTIKGHDTSIFLERGRVSYAKDIGYSEEAFKMFDHIIIYEGFNPTMDTLKYSHTVYLFSDYTKVCVDRLLAITEQMDEDTIGKTLVVTRDRFATKHAEKDIIRLIGLSQNHLLTSLPFNRTDTLRYENFTYDRKLATKGCSPELKDLLTYMFARALSLNEKTARKILKKL